MQWMKKRKRKNKAKTFGGRQMAPLYFECESRIFVLKQVRGLYFESHGNGSWDLVKVWLTHVSVRCVRMRDTNEYQFIYLFGCVFLPHSETTGLCYLLRFLKNYRVSFRDFIIAVYCRNIAESHAQYRAEVICKVIFWENPPPRSGHMYID